MPTSPTVNRLPPRPGSLAQPTGWPGPLLRWIACAAACLPLVGCSDDDDPPPPGVAQEPVVGSRDKLPGVVVTIREVSSRAGIGRANPGDVLTVAFTVATDSGAPLELATMARGAIMVSGPTFNYQRVIASQGDVLTRSVKTALGAFRYTFAVPIPATYLAPLNDSPALTEGELTGQALLGGTYTVGLELRKDYVVDGVTYRDPGNATSDFLLGSATALEPREVVTLANCNQCHGELRAHGDNRNNLTNCLLCHTSGAEDRNDPAVAGGTPGVSIDFKVMIHKIHAGKHLPSVNGVATNPDGTRNYAAPKQRYQLVGFNNTIFDYSDVGWPVWPTMTNPMPRDLGYGALTPDRQALENIMLRGPADCARCHGDPDGVGPLPAPDQGDLAYTQPSVAACNSCHDDWNPDYLYTSNNQTMPAERDNSTCKNCHRPSGTPLDVIDGHRHPLTDSAFSPGLVIDVQSIADVGNGNGRFETGERVEVTMTIKDKTGADVAAGSLSRIEAILNGPTTNPNLVHFIRVPTAGIGSGPVYTFRLPEIVYYEPIGVSDGATSGEVFTTSRAPHWNVSGAATALLLRTGTGTTTVLASAASAQQNYVDLAAGAGASFAKDQFVVFEDAEPGRREFLRIQRVEGDRLWFSSPYSPNYAPGLRFAHAANSPVARVIVPVNAQGQPIPIPAASYSLDALTGVITETTEFGAGEVLATYTTDFLVPDSYPITLNDSPDLGQDWGKWVGLPLLSGTYQLGLQGVRARTWTVSVGGQSQGTNYNEVSAPAVANLLFGTATTTQVVARIDGPDGCYRCHTDIQFHGGNRQGYASCILCHGVAGAEDAATYVYPAGEPSPGVTIDFRTMLHKIHAGKELAAGADYRVAGFGGTGYSYEKLGYPFMPGGVQNCASCHGPNSTAWVEPAERTHPAATVPTRSWRAACGSCHDSNAERAHIDVNTSLAGFEACAICHGIGDTLDVRTVHTVK